MLNHPSARVRRLALGTEREAAALQRQAEALEFDLPFEDADINVRTAQHLLNKRKGVAVLRAQSRSRRESSAAGQPQGRAVPGAARAAELARGEPGGRAAATSA